MNRSIETTPDPALQPEIAAQITRTRDKIFRTSGAALDLATDVGEFLARSTAYLTGRTIRATAKGARELYRGAMGDPFTAA